AKWKEQPYTAIAAQNASAVKFYPNPVTHGVLSVENGELKAGDRIEIYSLSGALVGSYEASGAATAVIDVSHLAAGVYVVKVGSRTGKVVKN
ncbi:MAG: T9SS type A sorting domain-containing protein, partial [Dysgonamonadaceae bacterium]|nr:T9SS type A sorting domain-containing protein [Dysgonamonadaceae bacterium]